MIGTLAGMTMTTGQKLLKLRESKGLSQARLAALTPVRKAKGGYLHETQYRRYEEGKGVVPPPVLLTFARYFGVSVEWLADESQGWPPPEAKDPDDDKEEREPGETLSDADRIILKSARMLGHDEAMRRLLQAPVEPVLVDERPRVRPNRHSQA